MKLKQGEEPEPGPIPSTNKNRLGRGLATERRALSLPWVLCFLNPFPQPPGLNQGMKVPTLVDWTRTTRSQGMGKLYMRQARSHWEERGWQAGRQLIPTNYKGQQPGGKRKD